MEQLYDHLIKCGEAVLKGKQQTQDDIEYFVRVSIIMQRWQEYFESFPRIEETDEKLAHIVPQLADIWSALEKLEKSLQTEMARNVNKSSESFDHSKFDQALEVIYPEWQQGTSKGNKNEWRIEKFLEVVK